LNWHKALRENVAMMCSQPLIEVRAVAPMMKNGYLLACPRTGKAAYIDPGDEVEEMLSWFEGQGLELAAILNTHAHMDHICGIRRLKERRDVPVYLHAADEFLYNALSQQGEWFGFRYDPAPPVDRYLAEGDVIPLGDLQIRVLHTPGHSPGSVSLVVGQHVFCGDLIFSGSVGRTDLPGGDPRLLLRMIREKILSLTDSTVLHPGHGPATTVGRERVTNPFLNGEL
jgi:glyoxylase-like metal-dependent hydrolase (beta-lactamase superfamily II)